MMNWRNVLPLLRKGYRSWALVLILSTVTVCMVAGLAACQAFLPPMEEKKESTPSNSKPQETPKEYVDKPSKAETTIKQTQEVYENGPRQTLETFGLAPIALAISNILTLAYATATDFRKRAYKRVVTSIERKSPNGIIPLLHEDTDTTTKKFAEKLVGQA